MSAIPHTLGKFYIDMVESSCSVCHFICLLCNYYINILLVRLRGRDPLKEEWSALAHYPDLFVR